MSQTGFIEQRTYRLEDLSKWLGKDDAPKAKDILQRLLLARIARPVQEENRDGWQDEALHGEYISGEIGQDTQFTFNYVGVVEIDGHVLKCYPKFIKAREPQPSDLRPILQAIERYKAEHKGLDTAIEASSLRMPNQLALALYLLHDYFTYGLYSNQREELTLHGQGEIDWETTINTTMPVTRDNRPYYFDYYTNDTRKDDTDYITRLHACIITECSQRLKTSELDEILQLETPTPYQGERIDFGTDDYICQRLSKELNVQFISQKQMLLRNLLTWVENANLATDASEIQMFGTNSFHTLWEVMCAEVFAGQYSRNVDTPLKSLGIKLNKEFVDSLDKKENTTLGGLIKKPQWQAEIGGKPHLTDTLIPDYIRIVSNNNHIHFVILDAKYYDIELDDKHVSGQPGVEDVSKQYLYHLAYNDFMQKHHMVSINAFVSPTDADASYIVGTASMPIFANLNLPAIQVVKLAASKVFENYNNHTHLLLTREVPALFSKE